MKKSASIMFVTALALVALTPAQSRARVFLDVGIGGGCCFYGPSYPYYTPYYSAYPAYYPPPVVYAAPQPPSTVIYTQQQPATTVMNLPAAAPPAAPAAGATPSQDFVDNYGRTCRYQTTSSGSTGIACVQNDGSWKMIQ